jgi:diguanylate cyclase (GGDEF)-like protein/PAS domain S-box-containing protein
MFKVYACLTTEHDLRLVAVAAAICLFVSMVGVSMFDRCRAAQGRSRLVWLALVGTSSGFGTWATHFIAMLAYHPSTHASYHLGLTLLSLALAILIIGAGAAIVLIGPSRWYAGIGGAVIGLGIAAMHYCGILAMQAPLLLIWSQETVLASILIAVAFGIPGAIAGAQRDNLGYTLLSAVLFTASVLSLHFTAMSAITALPAPDQTAVGPALSAPSLALVIAGAAAAILGGCLIAALTDRRSRAVNARQKLLLDIAIENMPQALCMFDAQGNSTLFNSHYAELVGIPAERLNGMNLLDQLELRKSRGKLAGDPQAIFDSIMEEIGAGRQIVKTDAFVAPGRVLRITEQPLPGSGWVATIEDVTEWRKTQERIAHLARHDALTDLPNCTTFREELDRVLRYTRREIGAAVLYIDLDHFKEINDTLGHPIGDELLIQVARRLSDCVRDGDLVARLGGDEFAVIQISHHEPESDAAALAMRIVSIVSTPYQLQGHHVSIGASVGIALAPADASEPDELIKKADLALYRAKAEGRGSYRFFELDMDASAQSRRLLTTELRLALTRNEFALRYQPIRDVESDEVLCFEALLRWEHPERGEILPDHFLTLADNSGLIVPIGDWVLQTACADAARWHSDVRVSVNLSPSQFGHPRLVPSVAAALTASGLPAHRLELEITETVLLRQKKDAIEVLRALRALGVGLSMDHFGAGYAALSSLKDFTFDRVKIDRSFIQQIEQREDAFAALSAVTGLGKRLGRATSATGVETTHQLALLRAAGCAEIQGILISPPCTAQEVKQMLGRDNARIVA